MNVAPVRKHLLLHLTARRVGGIESHVFSVAKALAGDGHHVALMSQRELSLPIAWERALRDAGVSVYPPLQRFSVAPANVRLSLTRVLLRRRIGRRRFDCLLAFGHGASVQWARNFLKADGQFIWYEYWDGLPTWGNAPSDGYGAPAPARFSRRMLKMIASTDVVVVGCDRAARNLRTHQGLQKPLHVVPPLHQEIQFLPARDRKYDGETRIHVGMLARHGRGKGTQVLVDLWPSLQLGPATLHLYGPISDGDLRLGSAARNCQTNVSIHGPVQWLELPSVLASLDLGLLLSVEEGYGLTVLEYMGAGTPVLMTDVGGATEFSSNNADLRVVPVSIEKVRRGIEQMVADIRRGATSRQRLQRHYLAHFGQDAVAAQHVALIREQKRGSFRSLERQ